MCIYVFMSVVPSLLPCSRDVYTYVCNVYNIGMIIHLAVANISSMLCIQIYSCQHSNRHICTLLEMKLGVHRTHVFLSLNPHRFHKHARSHIPFSSSPHYIFHIFFYTSLVPIYFLVLLVLLSLPFDREPFSLSLMEEYIKLIYDFVILSSLNAD